MGFLKSEKVGIANHCASNGFIVGIGMGKSIIAEDSAIIGVELVKEEAHKPVEVNLGSAFSYALTKDGVVRVIVSSLGLAMNCNYHVGQSECGFHIAASVYPFPNLWWYERLKELGQLHFTFQRDDGNLAIAETLDLLGGEAWVLFETNFEHGIQLKVKS